MCKSINTKEITPLLLLIVFATTGRVLASDINIIPRPHSLKCTDKTSRVAGQIYFSDPSLAPLAEVLSHSIFLLTNSPCRIVSSLPRSGIFFNNVPTIKPDAYSLVIKDAQAVLGASSYQGFVHGTASLIQLIEPSAPPLTLPVVEIQDAPAYPFRSVLLDLARFWNPVHTIKETIDLAYLYKFNHIHLHLSDDQSFTFPSRAFGKLRSYFPDGRRRHYTVEELTDIVEYARVRGIVVIPEIDVPSHASRLTNRLPEHFGTIDPETGKAKSTGVVNMASEKAYQALDMLFGEVAEVFSTSPYMHIGADEVAPGHLARLPEYMPYVTKHNLTAAQKGNTGELYSHFVVRMNEIVKKHGKKTIAWEGFHGTGSKNAPIPTDIIVMVWNMGFNPPNQLLKNGYTIINCAWKPLYIVPPQNYMDSQEFTYSWDIHEFQHRRTDIPYSKIPKDSDLLGAQICYWEQTCEAVIPALREHVPVVAERIWNPDAKLTFADFQRRFDRIDQHVENILRPVSIHANGLLEDTGETVSFDKSLKITLTSDTAGTVRFRLDDDWGRFPTAQSPEYKEPLTIHRSKVITAGLFDKSGTLLAPYTQQRYMKIEPAYQYRVFGPVPKGGFSKMPDFARLTLLRSGVLGYADKERMDDLNRVVFAKHPAHGHIDTQPYRQHNPFALELTGQIRIPESGEFTFQIKSPFGKAKVYFGETCVARCTKPGSKGEISTGPLQAGVYPFRIEYFYSMIQNRLNIQIKAEGKDNYDTFEKYVLALSQWKRISQLATVSADAVFTDPGRLPYLNLATDKPVTCSGESQPPNFPANAVDADISNQSGWHCGSSPQWLQVDLQKVQPIHRIKLHTYYDNRRVYTYTIEVSADGTRFIKVVDRSNNKTPSNPKGFDHPIESVKARYVRVNMLSNTANPGVHINELMVYGD